MKIFYFDVYCNDEESQDAFGTECETLLDASKQAQHLVVNLAQEYRGDRNNKDIVCVVRDVDRIVRYKTLLSLRSEWEEPSCNEIAQLPRAAYRLVR